MAAAWRCRCGYANVSVDRCGACHRRRSALRRRIVSGAFIAIVCMAASGRWSPALSAARTALTSSPAAVAPPPTPAPPIPAPQVVARPSQPPQRRPVAAPRVAAPAQAPTRAPSAAPHPDRCTAARQAVENAGDHLAAGFAFNCPDSTFPRWGATSVLPCGSCWVDINTALIPSDAVLRYVIAHEFCHSNGVSDEQAADDCAAHYGFPNVYFAR